MKFIYIFILLIGIKDIQSQNPELQELKKIKTKLQNEKVRLTDSIKKIELRINYLNSNQNIKTSSSENYIETRTRIRTIVKDKPDTFGSVIGYIAEETKIRVYDYKNEYWLVKTDSLVGYTSEIFLLSNKEMTQRKKLGDTEEILKKYGNEIGKKIINHNIWIGMTFEMARLSVGSPNEINKTTGNWGVHEQWVYDNKYLYFENGKLSSWQN